MGMLTTGDQECTCGPAGRNSVTTRVTAGVTPLSPANMNSDNGNRNGGGAVR